MDAGAGMPPALISKFLAEMGARIVRCAPKGYEQFAGYYEAEAAWRSGQEAISGEVEALLSEADIFLTGGEDFPGIDRPYVAPDLASRFPRLIILDITAYPKGFAEPNSPAVDLLVQARSGMVFEQTASGAVPMAFKPTLYGAVLHGLAGIFAALIERERSGAGQALTTSLLEGGLMWLEGLWADVEKPTPQSEFNVPKGAVPLIFECADHRHIQIMLGTVGGKKLLYDVLGLDSSEIDPRDPGLFSGNMDPACFFGDRALLAPAVAKWKCIELVEALKSKGLGAEPVLKPGESWDDAQTLHNEILHKTESGERIAANPLQIVATVDGSGLAMEPVPSPLSGLRVLDFGSFVAGPYASVFLAELGAEVIKVDGISGDPARMVFRSYAPVNRGKRVITLDLKSESGREIAARLCDSADIITNNFRTGVSERLGLDHKTLQQRRQNQVILECPGFGLTGPKAADAGFDMIMQALCGHQYRAGGDGGLPAWSRTSMVDYAGGALGTVAVLLGLYHLQHSKQGITLSVPLLNAGHFLMSELLEVDGSFFGAPSLNRERSGVHPSEAIYMTKDGAIAIAARSVAAAQRLAKGLELENMLSASPAQWGEDEHRKISEAFENMTVKSALAVSKANDVWAVECRFAFEEGLLSDPALVRNGAVQRVDYPQLGKVSHFGCFVHFSRSNVGPVGRAPEKGEHSREILSDLGYDANFIEQLFADGVVA